MTAGAQLREMTPSLPRQTSRVGDSAEMPARTNRLDARDLLLRHREGDREAFPALVAEYRAPVFAYLSRCGVDSADRDDLFQDIFIKIHRAASSYQAERPMHPWIFTIVANTVRSHLRKHQVRRRFFSEPAEVDRVDPADPSPDGERRTSARQAAAFIESELGRLRSVQRQVVILACVEKMPLKEVAGVLELPVNTVKTHLRRARLDLAEALTRRHRRAEMAS